MNRQKRSGSCGLSRPPAATIEAIETMMSVVVMAPLLRCRSYGGEQIITDFEFCPQVYVVIK